MKNFALIGAAGYVSPRHMKAIKDTSNTLAVALDPNDSMGIIDSYYPEAFFFTDFEKFKTFINKSQKTQKQKIDYFSIASPNYLHAFHISFALKSGADVICEKPLVLKPEDLDKIKSIENETNKKVYNILQLRLHPTIKKFKDRVRKELELYPEKYYEIDLTYITGRGKWFFASWKGNESMSGGIASNIGVHFFDILSWIFGQVFCNHVLIKKTDTSSGVLEFKNARVRWFLSINFDYLPKKIKEKGKTSYRSMILDGEEIIFDNQFSNLHTESYKEILSGNGFGLEAAKSSINIVSEIRYTTPSSILGNYHPYCDKVK